MRGPLELVEHRDRVVLHRDPALAVRVDQQRVAAEAVDEGEVGIVALAAAFAPSSGSPAVGTVSIAGPRARLDESRVAALAPLLLDAARTLGERWPLARRASSLPR